MCQPLPFLSYREKGERRPSSGTQANVGDSPGNTRAMFRSTRGKELGLWPGTWVFVGDRASSPTRFNTYSRGSTHLGVARPGPGFFLSFGSLGPGLVGTQDSGLGK
jgi:hypothetical protein